jgi:hypothetical protein
MVMVVAMLVLALSPDLLAQRNNLKPSDFEPLTSLPWKKENATLESVLEAIFREPNLEVRYPILSEYLRQIPVEQLGQAFDICIRLEGTQTPNNLVAFYLLIWAERDPVVCWKRTRELFRVVGIEDGWLNYDSWAKRSRITVQDPVAIRASPFWLESAALATVPLGVEQSSLPKEDRVRMMKEFADTWFAAFDTWPRRRDQDKYSSFESLDDLRYALGQSLEGLRSYVQNAGLHQGLRLEVGMRRWLELEPEAAPKIVSLVPAPPTELLMVWARRDLPGMIRWAETLDLQTDDLAVTARAFLMSRVDAQTREHWIRDVKSKVPDMTVRLLEDWAGWDPRAAMPLAVASGNPEAVEGVSVRAAYGPFRDQPYNSSHYGLGFIQGFDLASIPEPLHKEVISEWGITIMEQWGDIDIGEAARYGLDFMLRNNYAPRANLIELFSGNDKFASDSDMIDRTFCALRVWAVVRPGAMKEWIATQKDPEMRKALTWLLHNPWGGEKSGSRSAEGGSQGKNR